MIEMFYGLTTGWDRRILRDSKTNNLLTINS